MYIYMLIYMNVRIYINNYEYVINSNEENGNNNVSTNSVSTDNKIVQIALGGEHTCILYENNWIFSMGDNQVNKYV
jgi:alpha-tubulin suppressor-like RCC1 family protein